MVSIQDLLDLISANFDVVQLIDRGTTAGGLIYQWDLWHRVNEVVNHKRISIYYSGTGDAEWYASNPIPVIPTETFTDKVNAKIQWVYNNIPSVKYLAIDSIDNDKKRGVLIGYIFSDPDYVEKHAFIWEDVEGNIQYEIF